MKKLYNRLFKLTVVLALLLSVNSSYAQLTCNITANGISLEVTTACSGEDVLLIGSVSGGSTPYTHLWSDNGAGVLSGPFNNDTIIYTAVCIATGTYTFTYTVTDALGAVCTDNIVITCNPLPNLFAASNYTVCCGDSKNLTGLTTTPGAQIIWFSCDWSTILFNGSVYNYTAASPCTMVVLM